MTRSPAKLWCLHTPSGLIAAPNKLDADAKAAELNRFLFKKSPLRVNVQPWPWSASEHAIAVTQWAGPVTTTPHSA